MSKVHTSVKIRKDGSLVLPALSLIHISEPTSPY